LVLQEAPVAYLLVFAFIALLIFLIVKFADSDRYAKMTDEEFEAESKRASKIGGPIAAMQKLIDPGHRVEYVQNQKKRKPPESGQALKTKR
jgi:hypothetical protein